MTFLHFAACAVTTFGPHFAVYRGTGLCEQTGTRWLLCVAAFNYVVALLLKSLIVATILPATCMSSPLCGGINDIIKISIECAGLYYLLGHKQSLGFAPEARILCLGLGWSLGHVLCSNAHILLRAIPTVGFDVAGVFSSLEANVTLVTYMCMTVFIYLLRKKGQLRGQVEYLAPGLLVVCWPLISRRFIRPLISDSSSSKIFLGSEVTSSSWVSLATDALIAVACGILSMRSFAEATKTPSGSPVKPGKNE